MNRRTTRALARIEQRLADMFIYYFGGPEGQARKDMRWLINKVKDARPKLTTKDVAEALEYADLLRTEGFTKRFVLSEIRDMLNRGKDNA